MLPTYYNSLNLFFNNTLSASSGADWTGQQMQQQWGNAQPGLASAGQQAATGKQSPSCDATNIFQYV